MIGQVVNTYPFEGLLLFVEFLELLDARFAIANRNVAVHAGVHAGYAGFFAGCYAGVTILAIDSIFTRMFRVAIGNRLLHRRSGQFLFLRLVRLLLGKSNCGKQTDRKNSIHGIDAVLSIPERTRALE